jgi:hypothetical protein
LAVANYESSHGHYPPAYQLGPDGRPWHSWRVHILPFIEQNDLFKEYRFDEPWNGPDNRKLAERMPRLFGFADSAGSTTTNYLAVVGAETMWPGAEARKSNEIKDGSSQTILIVENNGLAFTGWSPAISRSKRWTSVSTIRKG